MAITLEQMRHTAKLARLDSSDEQLMELMRPINALIIWEETNATAQQIFPLKNKGWGQSPHPLKTPMETLVFGLYGRMSFRLCWKRRPLVS